MAQGTAGANILSNQISIADAGNLDSFGRLRMSQPQGIFDGQFTYDLQPLQFEQITNGTGATVTHDATNRNALMTFSSTATGGKAYMQSYTHFRYQPGKSQLVDITFNFIEATANTLKFAGYSDGTNGIEFQNNGSQNQLVLYSNSGNGNQTVAQANWNLDKLNGTGASGLTLDITKTQIFMVDLQALYVGRVRCGFVINGKAYYVHEFTHANIIAEPYIATANLPIRCGMTCTGTVSTTMDFNCCSVISEGGQEINTGYAMSDSSGVLSAGSGTATHFISIRPRTTFNSIANRTAIINIGVDVVVTGSFPVLWELYLGQAVTGGSWANVNATYSAVDSNKTASLSGSPAVKIDSGFVAASNTVKSAAAALVIHRYPITLDAAGAVRTNGSLTLAITGLGGASNCYAGLHWTEVR